MTTKNFVVKNGLTTGSITLDATSGNISGANLSVTGVSNLGAVGNVKITGGSSGYILSTDGSGNLSFSDPVATQSPAPMPTYIAVGNTVTISSNYQGIFGYPITVDGTIVVDGILVDVNDATVPAGNINYVQYNAGNTMGGDANFYYTAINGTMTLQNETIIGNSTIGNLVISRTANLGSVANVRITGGTNGYVLQTDGTGNLSWTAQTGSGGSGSPGGANTQVQFNDAGVFGGNSSFTFNKTTGLLNVTGNITSTTVSATGNITGSFILGNGSQLTGITATNASTAATVTTNAQPNITSTGTLASLSVSGNANIGNIGTAGLITATGNLNAGNLITTGIISATGNITGAYILGNGSQLSGITATTATTAGTVTTAAQPNITSVGTLTSVSVSGNANVGNLFSTAAVQGTTLTSNIATGTAPLTVTSTTLVPNLYVARANVADYDSVTTQTTGTYYLSLLSAVTGNIATSANSVYSANVANGSLSATTFVGALSGAATSATTAGTVTTAAQPNITSLGTLTSISVSGNANTGNLGTTGVFATTLSSTGNANVGNIGATGGVFTTVAGSLTTAAQPNITSTGTLTSISVSGNANIGNIGTAGLITATGNLNAGNIITGGIVSATGNGTFGNVSAITFTGSLAGTAQNAGNITTLSSVTSGTRYLLFASSLVDSSQQAPLVNSAFSTNFATGALNATLLGGTLTTAAQPNITSTGTLTSATISGNITAQANINMTGYVIRSVATSISAAGSTQGTATAITKEIDVVSTVASGAGVILPTAVAGMAITITNTSANSLLVYPATGAQINALGTNVGYAQASGSTLQFVAPTTTQWYSVGASYA